jgi:hypothetical protein
LESRSGFALNGRAGSQTQWWFGSVEAYGRHQHFERVREYQVVALPRGLGRELVAAFTTDAGAWLRPEQDTAVRAAASRADGTQPAHIPDDSLGVLRRPTFYSVGGVAYSRSPADSITALLGAVDAGIVRVRGTLPDSGVMLSLEAVPACRRTPKFPHR